MRARQQELQDEMIKVRLDSEQQARRTAFIDQNVDRLRSLPRAVPTPPVPVVHNHVTNTLVQPITTFVNNVQTNFHHVHNNVNVVHNQAVNFIQNHANRAINLAVNMGGSLANAYDALPAPRPSRRPAHPGRYYNRWRGRAHHHHPQPLEPYGLLGP